MKLLFVLLILAIQFGCTNNYAEVYSKSSKDNWHKIDLNSFGLETPNNYKFKPHQGIDSFVGEISSKKTKFSFDYGWYSNNEPLTPKEYLEKNIFRFHFQDLLDTMNVSNDSTNLKSEIRKNLIIKKVNHNQNGKYLAELEFKGANVNFPFEPLDLELENKHFNYEFLIEENENYYKKIYYPKDFEKITKAGVYIEDLKSKKKDKFNFTKLAFYTSNINTKNKEEILKILKTVKLNN